MPDAVPGLPGSLATPGRAPGRGATRLTGSVPADSIPTSGRPARSGSRRRTERRPRASTTRSPVLSGPRRPARRNGAVGIVLVDAHGRVLVREREVLREGHWVKEVRLPKGPLQPREPDAAAALSEVKRQTGYDDLEVVADLGRSPVDYQHRGVRYVRTEHYFLVRLLSHVKSDPNAPHDEAARAYAISFADSFDAAAAQLSFASEQSAVLRAKAWWPS